MRAAVRLADQLDDTSSMQARPISGASRAPAVPAIRRRTVLEVELARPWRCSSCAVSIAKGQLVRVHVVLGSPHNGVFHLECEPKT